MSYRYLGILLIVSPIFLCFIDNPMFALIIFIFLGAYYLKTPYKVVVENNTFKIFMLSGKHQIEIDDVRAVKMGVFHNRVDCEDNFYYLSHFLTNINSLTRKLAQKTGAQAFDQDKWDVIEKENDSPALWGLSNDPNNCNSDCKFSFRRRLFYEYRKAATLIICLNPTACTRIAKYCARSSLRILRPVKRSVRHKQGHY